MSLIRLFFFFFTIINYLKGFEKEGNFSLFLMTVNQYSTYLFQSKNKSKQSKANKFNQTVRGNEL